MEFKKYVGALGLLSALVACNNKESINNADQKGAPAAVEASRTAVKVYVASDGKITADGKQTTLYSLDKKLAQLANDSGTVYFSRANAQGDGPIESMQVMETVMKNGVAIKFFTDSTFTHAVDMEGQAQ